MKLLVIVTVLSILCGYTASSQELLWQKQFGGASSDDAVGAVATPDGGYIVLGQTFSYRLDSTIGFSGYLVKIDADGNGQWERPFGRSSLNMPGAIMHHDSGRYIIFGSVKNGTQTRYSQFSVTIVDSTGAVVRETNHGNNIQFNFSNVARTSDGGFIITGFTSSLNSDTWLWKLDRDGNVEWSKLYTPLGDDRGQGVVELGDGGYMVVGFSTATPSAGFDIMLLRVDADGDSLWRRNIVTPFYDEGRDIYQQEDGNLLVVGQAISGIRRVVDVVRTTVDGELLSSDTFGFADREVYFRSSQRLPGGGFVLSGWTQHRTEPNGAYMAMIDNDGRLRWQQEYAADSLNMTGLGVVATSSTESLLVGQIWGPSTGQTSQMLVMKIRSLSTGVDRELWRPRYIDLR